MQPSLQLKRSRPNLIQKMLNQVGEINLRKERKAMIREGKESTRHNSHDTLKEHRNHRWDRQSEREGKSRNNKRIIKNHKSNENESLSLHLQSRPKSLISSYLLLRKCPRFLIQLWLTSYSKEKNRERRLKRMPRLNLIEIHWLVAEMKILKKRQISGREWKLRLSRRRKNTISNTSSDSSNIKLKPTKFIWIITSSIRW